MSFRTHILFFGTNGTNAKLRNNEISRGFFHANPRNSYGHKFSTHFNRHLHGNIGKRTTCNL